MLRKVVFTSFFVLVCFAGGFAHADRQDIDERACAVAIEAATVPMVKEICQELAETGSPSAIYKLGKFYETGDIGDRNLARAAVLYERAAAEGYSAAQLALADLYIAGDGILQNYAKAVDLLRAAGELGNALAQYRLGKIYHEGKIAPKDYRRALRWYRLAAEQGEARAQYGLGIMFYRGEGVRRNLVKSHMWFNVSAALGHEDAARRREFIAARMQAEEILEAQSQAVGCVQREYLDC